MGAAAVYVGASLRLGILLDKPVLCGLAYGIPVWAFMNLVVLPLSAIPFELTRSVESVATAVVILMVCVGLPIALWLGHVLEDVGEAEAASDAYARAHALAPQEPQIAAYLLAWRRKLCDWRDLDALAAQVRAAVNDGTASVEPFAFLS